jgi:hypothetical protein
VRSELIRKGWANRPRLCLLAGYSRISCTLSARTVGILRYRPTCPRKGTTRYALFSLSANTGLILQDTLIFKSGPPVQRYIFPLSFNQGDKVRLIDPPNAAVKQAFDMAVRVSYRNACTAT